MTDHVKIVFPGKCAPLNGEKCGFIVINPYIKWSEGGLTCTCEGECIRKELDIGGIKI